MRTQLDATSTFTQDQARSYEYYSESMRALAKWQQHIHSFDFEVPVYSVDSIISAALATFAHSQQQMYLAPPASRLPSPSFKTCSELFVFLIALSRIFGTAQHWNWGV